MIVTRSRTFPLRQILLVAGVILGGLLVRLHGLGSSLWLDEFGTVWCVDGSAGQTVARAQAFQGQSPFYYLIAWLPYSLVGPSEWALRLPSVLAWVSYSVLLVLTTVRCAGRDGAVIAALVSAVSVPLAVYAASARPYMTALALMMWCLYFVERARVTDSWRDTIGAGVTGGLAVLSHYLVGLGFAGVIGAFLCCPSLRRRLSGWGVFRVTAVAAVVSSLGARQFLDLLGRSAALEWLDGPNLLLTLGLFLLLAPPIAIGIGTRALRWQKHGHLFASLLLPVVGVAVAYGAGVNLVHPRYLIGALPATTVLASIAAAPRAVTAQIGLIGLLALNGMGLYWNWRVSGTATLVNSQDWRGAVRLVTEIGAGNPNAVLFYRSGFVEQDVPPVGRVRDVDLRPLRSPGSGLVSLPVFPLTYRWNAEGRSDYFRCVLQPLVRPGTVLVYVSPTAGGHEYFAHYRKWLAQVAPVATERTYAVTGMNLLATAIPEDATVVRSQPCE